MPYNANIPQPTDILAQSQNDILNNFQAIGAFVAVNHEPFGSPDEGKHKQVVFPVQAAPPAPNVGEIGLVNFLDAVTAVNELYITNSANVSYPITASILSTNAAPGNNVSGWTILPSGILLKWGSGNANGLSNTAFPVAANIPVFNGVMSVIITTYENNVADTNTFARLSNFSNLSFNVYGSQRTAAVPAAVSFQYLAIGY